MDFSGSRGNHNDIQSKPAYVISERVQDSLYPQSHGKCPVEVIREHNRKSAVFVFKSSFYVERFPGAFLFILTEYHGILPRVAE